MYFSSNIYILKLNVLIVLLIVNGNKPAAKCINVNLSVNSVIIASTAQRLCGYNQE